MAEYYASKPNDLVDAASWYIVSTCQVVPKASSVTFDCMHNLRVTNEARIGLSYTILCGSQAELYIRPLHSCISDIDYLICDTDMLAFICNYQKYSNRAKARVWISDVSDVSGLADTVIGFMIEPYHEHPGFVRIRVALEMNYNWKRKRYEYKKSANCGKLASIDKKNRVSGPANKQEPEDSTYMGIDFVRSVFCPQWPREAKAWPARSRKYGWPTTDTISEVVQSGCHIVNAQHRSCRDDNEQWRLSFSFAEVILLQSWTKIQQLTYHLLRFFAKRELMQKDCPKDDEVLCSYHLKTLMLWTCEEMSPEWWNSNSLIAICCELLKKLSHWLKRGYCPNYFIPEANLFHQSSKIETRHEIQRRLSKCGNAMTLCHWFVINYLLLSFPNYEVEKTIQAGITPQLLKNYFKDVGVFRIFLKFRILDGMISSRLRHSFLHFHTNLQCKTHVGLRQFLESPYTCKNGNVHSEVNAMGYLPTIEKVLCLKYSANILFILHTAKMLSCGNLSLDSVFFVELINAISTEPKLTRSQYHNVPKTHHAQSSLFHFRCATDIMENLTGSNGRSEFQFLSIISKQFLRKAVQCDDSQLNGIASAALVYLAAFQFATSEYQQAIKVCSAVLVDQSSREDEETLNAGCLLFIDDVATIVGLLVLCKKITKNLHYIGKRIYLDLRFSPKVFAHYLIVLSAKRMYSHLDCYCTCNWPHSTFPMDKNLKLVKEQICTDSRQSGTQFKAAGSTDLLTNSFVPPLIPKETVFDALMGYAMESITSFYNVICRDFGIQCNTADCYRALFLYKCRKYDEVLQLCEQIFQESDLLRDDLKKLSFVNVLLLPPFDSLFDGDVQSLLAFHALFSYFSLSRDDVRRIYETSEKVLALKTVFHRTERALFLMNWGFSTECHYFIGRHFLARYLKVRCYIDSDLPYVEALTEFAAQKTNFPFEQMIRMFLLQKLSSIKK